MTGFRLARSVAMVSGLLTALAVTNAVAQTRSDDKNACGRDATRLCGKVLGDGDFAVLSCLQANRPKLRPVCAKYLVEKGQ